MKVGDLVKLKDLAWGASSTRLGVIIQGPVEKVVIAGPSLVEHVEVAWNDGYESWHYVDHLEVINESRGFGKVKNE